MKSHLLENSYHLGDCLVALHLLRALAKQAPDDQFIFFTHGCNLPQLAAVVSDIPNILMFDFENPMWAQEKHRAINTWKNADDAWTSSPLQYNWSSYTLWHHSVIARKMGFESPFKVREHLLFDYPALAVEPLSGPWAFHFLIGDSAPNSGQYSEWADHSKRPLDDMIAALREKYSVRTTSELKDIGYTITEIGKLSQFCQHHIMVPNGPFWPTFSTHNHHNHEGRRRIVLLDNGENLNLPHITQCGNVVAVWEIARKEGWISG